MVPEIFDNNANKKKHEQKCEYNDEECVEESLVNDIVDLRATRKFAV